MTTREEMDQFCIEKLTDEGIVFCVEGKEVLYKGVLTEKDILSIVVQLTSFVNSMSTDRERLFAKAMMNEHRTLQQSTMRLFMTCIEEWSKQEFFDLRNEQTIKLCKKIMEAVGDTNHLPLI